MASFEATKGDIVSSSLGQAIGLTASSVWSQIVEKIKAVVNRGALNWSESNTTKTVDAGYYTGGSLDSRPSYNNGYNAGVTAADNRSNPNSTNYKTGYNAGVAAADNRVNTGSASYTSGYNAGVNAGKAGISLSPLYEQHYYNNNIGSLTYTANAAMTVLAIMLQPNTRTGKGVQGSLTTTGSVVFSRSLNPMYNDSDDGSATYFINIIKVNPGNTITATKADYNTNRSRKLSLFVYRIV